MRDLIIPLNYFSNLVNFHVKGSNLNNVSEISNVNASYQKNVEKTNTPAGYHTPPPNYPSSLLNQQAPPPPHPNLNAASAAPPPPAQYAYMIGTPGNMVHTGMQVNISLLHLS